MAEFDLEKELYEVENLNEIKQQNYRATALQIDILKKISLWQLEAKYGEETKYFYKTGIIAPLLKGDKYFVIGRKGTGKTAICQYFMNLSKLHNNVKSQKLSFKNFPYNELYENNDDAFPSQSKYITLWKYLIYNTLLELCLSSQDIKKEIKKQLYQIYKNYDLSFDRKVRYWLGDEFSINFMGSGFSTKRTVRDKIKNWIKIVDDLEDLVFKVIDNNIYFILFDELDEDYKKILESEQCEKYTSLLLSLFKAVQYVFDSVKKKGKKIYPIIFLRDDIYDILRDPDKTKNTNFKIEIEWNEETIKNLLLHRINAISARQYTDFDKMWKEVISNAYISRRKKNVPSFYYISRSTHNRPRDYVCYLIECSKLALKRDGIITASVIKDTDKQFSNYFKDELIDELFSVYPEITEIFDCISQQRKWIFSQKDFETIFLKKKQNGLIPDDRSLEQVLQVLFWFSVIGNETSLGNYIFRYQKPNAKFNYRDNIVVHRGLFKALQII